MDAVVGSVAGIAAKRSPESSGPKDRFLVDVPWSPVMRKRAARARFVRTLAGTETAGVSADGR